MELENEVCSFEQAKKLKELGLAQNSLFFWTMNANLPFVDTLYDIHQNEFEPIAAAYTCSELGILLDGRTFMLKAKTEAQGRANLLIELIQSKRFNVNDLNSVIANF